MKKIYCDYLATTPVDERVLAAMLPCFQQQGCFGNPANLTHDYGRAAHDLLDKASGQVAQAIGASCDEIVWTSGATESDNLALLGVARARRGIGNHIIISAIEHPAVLLAAEQLRTEGFSISQASPDQYGVITATEIAKHINTQTILVSVMHVNNEIGAIAEIANIAACCREHKIPMHVDCAQSIGKVKVDCHTWGIDFASFSAHKAYGPKGIGALYVNRRIGFQPKALQFGGGQQHGFRPGTLPVPLIVGMGEAFVLATENLSAQNDRLDEYRASLWQMLADLGDITLNSHLQFTVPHCLNISFPSAEEVQMILNTIACSTGSACRSGSNESSHVLQAIGVSKERAKNAVRLSLGRYTTRTEIENMKVLIRDKIRVLREALT